MSDINNLLNNLNEFEDYIENLNNKVGFSLDTLTDVRKSIVRMKNRILIAKTKNNDKILSGLTSDKLKILTYDEWYKINVNDINIELAENDADRELDFDIEKEFNIRYEGYLKNINNLTVGELIIKLNFAIENGYITNEHTICIAGNGETCIVQNLTLPAVILDNSKEFKYVQMIFTK